MAETPDIASKLADGTPAVADIQHYVTACHALGYQHPELTSHAAQVHDRYTSEDGMDLRALDADCAALQTACTGAEEALARQDAQRLTLAAAWQGTGAQASREFLTRHDQASAQALAAVRSAAHTLAELRDRLWHAVDGKVAAVLAVEEAAQARRGDWLAAAQTVTTGAGDRSVASELVDQEVKPFVDTVIGGQWLAAMHTAADAIEAAYDAANAALASQAAAVFEVPGALGPVRTGSGEPPVAAAENGSVVGSAPSAPAPATSAVPVASAGWSAPAAAPPALSAPVPPPAVSAPMPPPAVSAPAIPPPADQGAGMAAPSMPSLGGGGGMPDIGSGLSGFGQQLRDLVGGLLGDAETEPSDIDDSLEVDEPVEVDEPEDDEPEDDEPEAEEGKSDPEAEEPKDPVDPVEPVEPATAAGCPPEPPPAVPVDAPPDEPAATPPPEPAEPAPAEPLAAVPEPPAGPASGSGTPCEIAADELPQVGE